MVDARRKRHNAEPVKNTTSSAPSAPKPVMIHKKMTVGDIVTLCPDSENILAEYGLHCFNCSIGGVEQLEEGCRMHGFEDDEIDELVSDLNDLLQSTPKRPQTLTVTAPAARAIRSVAKAEGRIGEGLVVTADGRGGFCLEFRDSSQADEMVFHNKDEPDVRIFASTITLTRIGGSTIDFREERFKLDLPEDCCRCDNGQNACTCA